MRLFEQTVAKCSGGAIKVSHRRAIVATLTLVLVAVTIFVGQFPVLFDANPRKIPLLVIDLRDSDVSRAMLRRKDLRFASAGKAKVAGADLRDADLRRADFQRASFVGADLESARLTATDLDSADFTNACLRKAELNNADMEDASFRGAYLGRVDLRSRLLTRANFQDANLQGADLQDAVLTGADLRRASLRCFISGKKGPDPQVQCTNLQGARLDKARLDGADLRYVTGLTQEQLAAACGNAETAVPDGLHVPLCTEEPTPPASPPAEENSCSHEMRDDRWPQ